MHLNPNAVLAAFALAAGTLAAAPGQAQTLVTGFATGPAPDGVWFESEVDAGGTASVVADTATAAGPLPAGAARLTTVFDNDSVAEVSVANDYGRAVDIFPTLVLGYDFLKAANPGQNLAVTPAIKLTLYAPPEDCTADADTDCFGKLVYEPYWNDGVGPAASCEAAIGVPPVDTWSTVAGIDYTTGCFWWTGGFGQPNGAGGPPLRTLAEWEAAFNANFANARVVAISVGVGTWNQGQVGYFDAVEVSHAFGAGFARSYDFEAVRTLDCVGFDAPVGDRVVKVKKNRVIPFKALLVDAGGAEVAGGGLAAPPVVNVSFTSADTGAIPEDVTADALAAGQGSAGNAFAYADGRWQFNLSTRNYSEAGTYTVTMRSGDAGTYGIGDTCTGTFVIE